MDLTRRLDRLEGAAFRRTCPESHVAITVTTIDVDGTVQAGPEPGPCIRCGGARELVRLCIETVEDATEEGRGICTCKGG
jgi:hypothetical protein